MKFRNCIFLTTTALFTSILSIKNSLAGDYIFNMERLGHLDKPNTGDTNTFVIYGAIALIALISLILLNLKDSNKNTSNKEEDMLSGEEKDNLNDEK